MSECTASIAVSALLADSVSRRVRSGWSRPSWPRGEARVVAPLASTLTQAANKPRRINPQVQRLTKADKRLRKMVVDAESGRTHTLEEIAVVMGITRERVRQIEMRALRTFRNRLTWLIKGENVTPGDLRSMLESGGER